ncbi:hypothetical protein ACNQR9_25905 [Mycolicibacterium peregrinum]
MTDRIETVIAEQLATNLADRLEKGPRWGTHDELTKCLAEEARAILAALKAARIAVVELPEPTDRGHFDEVDDGTAGWISFPEGVSATHPKGTVFDQDADLKPADARNLAASLLAAADAAEASQ